MINFRTIAFSESDLQELLKLDINMVFQPIYSAKSMEIYAYEALMRPAGKTPLELIAEYQENDKLSVIELATCFGAALEYKNRGYDKKLCINSLPSEVLTNEQSNLYYDNFPHMIGNIVVEIVEYTTLNKHKWGAKKEDVEVHNLYTAVDDFCTGNNDSSAVEFFHPNFVKLDQSLISDIHNDPEKQENLRDIVERFHEMNIEVVAEGIETKEELDYLRDVANVDYLQGYYLGKPQ